MVKGRISIIVPMYNASNHIEKCLESISGQTIKDFEVILVDDNSIDDTVQKAEKYHYEIIKLEEQKNPGAARNRGAEKASGDILVFVDSDIVLCSDSIEKISAYASEADTDVVSGTYAADMPQTNYFGQFQNLMAAYRQSNLPEVVTFTNSAFCAVKRKAFEAVGGYDGTMPYYEDVEIGHRFTQNGFKCKSKPDLKVVHLKQFSHLGLLRDYFKKVTVAGSYERKNLFKKTRSEELSFSLKIAGVSSGLVLLSVPFSGINPLPFFLLLSLYSISTAKLLRFLVRNRNLMFGIKSYFVCYEVCLVSLVAMVYGVLTGGKND